MTIKDGIATFQMNETGEITNETYRGTFQVKCLLSPIGYMDADKLYRQLLGDHIAFASERARNAAFALSQLKYRIIRFPPFWGNPQLPGGQIEDDNIVQYVFEESIKAEEKYREQKQKEISVLTDELTNAITNGTIEKEGDVSDIPLTAKEEEIIQEEEVEVEDS